MEQLIEALIADQDIDVDVLRKCFDELCEGHPYPPEQLASLLVLLRSRGETAEQLAAIAETITSKVLSIDTPRGATCLAGTGGDNSNSFNISTAASLLLAACGVAVPKAGNKAITSQCGSADVLKALGVPTELDAASAAACINETGFAFLLATIYFPSYRYIAPVRDALKVPTLFNILGPLLNSAYVDHQMIGVFDRNLLDVMAGAALQLGYQKAMVVSSADGLDEISLTDETYARLVENGQITSVTIKPEDYGLSRCRPSDLLGGDASNNATIIENILAGEAGPKTDCVLLNTGVALFIANKANNIEDGIAFSKEVQESGAGLSLLNKLREFRK